MNGWKILELEVELRDLGEKLEDELEMKMKMKKRCWIEI